MRFSIIGQQLKNTKGSRILLVLATGVSIHERFANGLWWSMFFFYNSWGLRKNQGFPVNPPKRNPLKRTIVWISCKYHWIQPPWPSDALSPAWILKCKDAYAELCMCGVCFESTACCGHSCASKVDFGHIGPKIPWSISLHVYVLYDYMPSRILILKMYGSVGTRVAMKQLHKRFRFPTMAQIHVIYSIKLIVKKSVPKSDRIIETKQL